MAPPRLEHHPSDDPPPTTSSFSSFSSSSSSSSPLSLFRMSSQPSAAAVVFSETTPLLREENAKSSANYATATTTTTTTSNNTGIPNGSPDEADNEEVGSWVKEQPQPQPFIIASLRAAWSRCFAQDTALIGWWGSLAIAVNSLTGPAMLTLPATFQTSGIIPTTVALIFVCLLSSLCSLHMANTISKVPGNAKFTQNIEYSDVFRTFWGGGWFVFTQVAYFGCITCLNISGIVDTARIVDTFLGHWLPGGSVALQWYNTNDDYMSTTVSSSSSPSSTSFLLDSSSSWWTTTSPFSWRLQFQRWTYSDCLDDPELVWAQGNCIPFLYAQDGVLLTLGYLVTTALLLPLALLDLKENALWQIIGFVILLVITLQFVVAFIQSETFNVHNVSLWGESWSSLFGVILFNFCLVIAIPAWLYEKDPRVSVTAVIHSSSILSTLLYILVGILGACSLPNVSENMLESMMSGAMGSTIQWSASIFDFAVVGLSVPLFCVLTRLNLTSTSRSSSSSHAGGNGNGGGGGTSGMMHCSHAVGNGLAVFLPFGISWMLYHRVTDVLSWGGVLFTSMVAFLLPLLLAWHAVMQQPSPQQQQQHLHDHNELCLSSGSIDVYCLQFWKRVGRFCGRGSTATTTTTTTFTALLDDTTGPPTVVTSTSSQKWESNMLVILLFLAVASILAAIAGLVVG